MSRFGETGVLRPFTGSAFGIQEVERSALKLNNRVTVVRHGNGASARANREAARKNPDTKELLTSKKARARGRQHQPQTEKSTKLNERRNFMEKKRGRGRPRVTEYLAEEQSAFYEKAITNGKQYRSRRSISDIAYAITASSILSEAASEIEDLELLFTPQYMVCRSILNQLGRMSLTEGYSNESVIHVAKAAIQSKKNGYSVKEIERYIRNGRLTGKW